MDNIGYHLLSQSGADGEDLGGPGGVLHVFSPDVRAHGHHVESTEGQIQCKTP